MRYRAKHVKSDPTSTMANDPLYDAMLLRKAADAVKGQDNVRYHALLSQAIKLERDACKGVIKPYPRTVKGIPT